MPLLALSDASLAFGDWPLLDHVDFQLDAGERVALIGRNGTGKSSMLGVLAGRDRLDDGEHWQQPGLRIGYVPQEPSFSPEQTVFAAVVAGMGEVSALLDEYHAVSLAVSTAEREQEQLLERMHTLQTELELRHAWSYEAQATRAIARFSLDADAHVGALSGGQKKRLALAQALAVSPDVLLLDEPTNHLDIAAIEWLEEMLLALAVTLVVITHDRRFLDRVATRIVELDRGHLSSFPGSFRDYQTRKEAMLLEEAVVQAKFDKFLAQEEVWIRQGIKARRTRNEGRVLRLERLRRERAARRERQGTVELSLDAGVRSGKLVARLEHVSKSFGEQVVVRDFSCRLQRGDKVGVIGPNGVGKTTLLRLILGDLAPDTGQVRLGSNVQTAYFDQFRAQLDEQATLSEIISPGSDFVQIGKQRKHVIGYLGDFLFSPERARSRVSSLSGGERNRLLLARLFARPANVLVLDEPTNDLDVETLELLEALLQDYEGTLFLVSHDRTFLDNVVTQTMAAEGNGVWREYAGGYQDWADYQAAQRKGRTPDEKPRVTVARRSARTQEEGQTRTRHTAPGKLSWKEARELAELPVRIAALEAEQQSIGEQLANPALYQSQPREAARLSTRLTEIDEELLALLERWEQLETTTTPTS